MMLPTVWEPFETMRFFDRDSSDIVRRLFSTMAEETPTTWTWKPTVDVIRDSDELIVKADLPGVDPEEDIDVTIDGAILSITGRRAFDKEVSEENRYIVERAYGSFRRDIALPEGVDPDALKADYEDGVLTITVPLPEAMRSAEPKKIPIKVEKLKKLIGGKKHAA